LWSNESQQELEPLRQKYPERHAIRLMWAARIIAAETGLDPEHPMRAAVRAVEKIETWGALREEHRGLALWLSNMRAKRNADKHALEDFYAWQQRCRAVDGMDAAQRVKKYCSLKRITARQKQRIRALLKAGKLV
jgi:exopolyphosphatase/pppGpp-phosphohydrolase